MKNILQWIRSQSGRNWDFCTIVEHMAMQHLVRFGLKKTYWKQKFHECVIELEHCDILFWQDRNEMGSYIRPKKMAEQNFYDCTEVARAILPLTG